MDEPPRYATDTALRATIAERAKRAAAVGPMSAADHIRQFDFSRLLARIFHPTVADEWILKGGQAALVRIHDARVTRDMDLMSEEADLDASVSRLATVIRADLGDHYDFELVKVTNKDVKPGQAGVSGRKLSLAVYCGKPRPNITIDLVAESALTEAPERAEVDGLRIPGITPPTVRLYPLVDHIADKVAATHTVHPGGHRSTRIRDMVDLVLFALSQTVDGASLTRALRARSTRMQHPTSFDAPPEWRDRYPSQARRLPLLAEHHDFDVALALLAGFLDPVLTGQVDDSRWDPDARRWASGGKPPSQSDSKLENRESL